jgi:putative Mn2+ efflux pump MntP
VIFVEVIFLAVALSADAVVFGLSFGMKDIKIPLYSLFLMTAVGFLTLGEIVFSLVPIGESLGAFILVGLGIWLICDSDDGAKDVINHPEKIDIDNSRIIEPVEAIITGFALSVDSVSVCLGYGASGKNSVVLPILVTLFQIIFLYGGIIMSKKIRLKTRVNCITLISGLIIMIIGLYKLVPFFS